MADFEDDYSDDDSSPSFFGMESAGPAGRLTGQVAPTPQPVYQDASQGPEELDAPRNYTGDQGYNASQFATSSASPAADSEEAENRKMQPFYGQAGPTPQPDLSTFAAGGLAVNKGRAVKSAAPVKFVTNSQGKTVPINAGGNDSLSPIPGNAKYLTGKNGDLYHATPDDTGTFTRAESSLASAPDGTGRLRSHVPGLGYIDQGEDTKFTAKAAEKQQQAQAKQAEKDAQQQAAATLADAQAGTANILAQSEKGAYGVGAAKAGIPVINAQMENDVLRATAAHTDAQAQLKSAQDALKTIHGDGQMVDDSFKDVSRQISIDNRKKQAAGGHDTATSPRDDDGNLLPPLEPGQRKLLDDAAAKRKEGIRAIQQNIQSIEKAVALSQVNVETAKAKKADWLIQRSLLNQGLAQTEAGLSLYKSMHILTDTGRIASIEALPAIVQPPPDFNKYNADAPQPTVAEMQAAGTDLAVQQNPNLHTPTVATLTGNVASLPPLITDPNKPYLAAVSKASNATAYNVPDDSVQYRDGSVMTPDGKVMADIQHELNQAPRFYMRPDASGQYHSLSLKSGHPYDGVPEYQAPLPSHLEAMDKVGIDTSDRPAVMKAWEANHWQPDKMSKFISDWQGANDDERQDLILQTGPDQAKIPKGQRQLNTRELYRSGQISLQEARHLDFVTKGRAPGMQDSGDSFANFRASDDPAAKYLRSFDNDTGANPVSLSLKAKATAAAVSAWGADYIKRNGNSADFDPQAFAKDRDAMYGKKMGPFERVAAGGQDMAEGLVGAFTSIPVTALNFGLGLLKSGGKQAAVQMGMSPETADKVTGTIENAASKAGNITGVNIPKLIGVHANTPTDEELLRQRTEQFGRNAYTFISGRANLESAKDLFMDKSLSGQTGASPFWYGKDGAKVKNASDALFDLIDKDQLTQAKVRDIGGKLNDYAIAQHGITNYDKTNKVGFDYNGRYDLTDARSPLAQMVAGYAESRDPAYKAMFHQALSTSAGEEETQKALAEYLSTHGHIAGTPVGTVMDWIDRNTRHSLNYQDPHAFETLRTSAADTTQPLQMVGAMLAMEGFSAAPGLLRASKGAVSPAVRGAGIALSDSAKVAAGAATLADVLPAYTMRALPDAASPVMAAAKQTATSALHGGVFMGATAVGQPGASMDDVAQSTGEGMLIGAGLGIPGAFGKGIEATEAGRTQAFADTWNKRFPGNPIDQATASQAAKYAGADEAPRLDAMHAIKGQIDDIQQKVKAGTATPEESNSLKGLRDALDSHFVSQQIATSKAVAAAQEVNGIADKPTRDFVHGLLKSRQGATLTQAERESVLRMVDTTATPDVNGQFPSLAPEQPDGSFIITDAGLKAVQDAAPATYKSMRFPNSETEQLDALKNPAPDVPPVAAPPVSTEIPPETPVNASQPAESAPVTVEKPVVPGARVMTAKSAGSPDVHYVEHPNGQLVAHGETGAHPQSFPHEAAFHQHFGRPLTAPEKVTLAKERQTDKRAPQPQPVESNATRPASAAKPEHQGVPQGTNVSENGGEVRPRPGEQAGGGRGVRGEGTQPVQRAGKGGESPRRQVIRDQISRQLKGTKFGDMVEVHDQEPDWAKPNGMNEATGGMQYFTNGKIEVSLPTIERSHPHDSEQALRARVSMMLDEELRHHADELGARAEFDKHDDGIPYGLWKKGYYGNIWDNGFTAEQRKAVLDKYGSDLATRDDEFKAREGLRMLSQIRETGQTSETWREVLKPVLDHLKSVYDALTSMAKGKLTPGLESQLQSIKQILAEHGYDGLRLDEPKRSKTEEYAAKMKAEFAAKIPEVSADQLHEHAKALDTAASHIEATGGVHHVENLRNDAEALRKAANSAESTQSLASSPAGLDEKTKAALHVKGAQLLHGNEEMPQAEWANKMASHVGEWTRNKLTDSDRRSSLGIVSDYMREQEPPREKLATFLSKEFSLLDPDQAPDSLTQEGENGGNELRPIHAKQAAIFEKHMADAAQAVRSGDWEAAHSAINKAEALNKQYKNIGDNADALNAAHDAIDHLSAREKSPVDQKTFVHPELHNMPFDQWHGWADKALEGRDAGGLHSAPDPDAHHRILADLMRNDEGLKTREQFKAFIDKHIGEHQPEGYADKLYDMAFPEGEESKPAPKAEPKPKPENAAAIYNEAIDEKRKELGLAPIMSEAAQDHPELWKKVEKTLADNSRAGDELVDKLNTKAHDPGPEGHVLLLRTEIERTTALDSALNDVEKAKTSGNKQAELEARTQMDAALSRLNDVHEAIRRAGTAWGRSGRARQILAKNAVDYQSMLRQMSALSDGKLTDKEAAQVKARSQELQETQKRLDAAESAQKDEANHGTVKTDAAYVRSPQYKATSSRDLTKRLSSQRDAILKRITSLGASPNRVQIGRHGGWLDESGNMSKVDNTYGHADVIESVAPGVKIKTPEDYNQAYGRHFVRLTNAPDAIYVTYGKETLNSRQNAALDQVDIDTGKKVVLDTGDRHRILYDYRGPSDSLRSSPAYPLHDFKQVGMFHLADGKTDYGEWKKAMADDFGDSVKPHLEKVYRDSLEGLKAEQAAADATRTPEGVVAAAKAKMGDEPGEIDPSLVRKVARAHLEVGHEITDVASSKALMEKSRKSLAEVYPEASREQIRDAYAGYKERTHEVKSSVEQMASEAKAQLQNVAKLEDIDRGVAPHKLGDPSKPSDEVRRLTKAVREGMEREGLISRNPEKELANREARIKSTLENQIKDLEDTVAGKVKPDTSKPPVTDSPEIKAMRSRVKALREARDSMDSVKDANEKQRIDNVIRAAQASEHEYIQMLRDKTAEHGKAKTPETNAAVIAAQRSRDMARKAWQDFKKEAESHMPEIVARDVAKKLDAALAQEADLRAKMAKGDLTVTSKKPGATSTPLEEVRARVKKLQAELHQARLASGALDARKLATYKKILETRSAKLEEQRRTGNFTNPPREPYKFKDDAMAKEAQAAKAAHNQVKAGWEVDKEKKRLESRDWKEKGYDLALKARRAEILSSYVTMGKLGMAAGYQTLAMFPDEIAGGVMSHIPGLSKIAARAPIEGGMNLSSVGRSVVKGWVDGIRDFGKHVREGGTEIDKAHDPDWAKHQIDRSKLDYIGSIHGALKAPAKIAAFEHAMTKALGWAEQNGQDPKDPVVQAWAATKAYERSKRAVFGEKNWVNDQFKSLLGNLDRQMRDPKNEARHAARVAHFALSWLFPITKIPLNIAKSALVDRSPIGLASGSIRAVHAIVKGTEHLTEDQADTIMRKLKQGAVGSALGLIGYLGYQHAGGLYNQDRRKQNPDVPPDRFRVGGKGSWISPQWATHSPLFDEITMGANLRRLADSIDRHRGGKEGIPGAAFETLLGEMEHVPFYSTPKELLHATEDQGKISLMAGQQAASLVPAFARDYASGKGIPSSLAKHMPGVDVTPQGDEISRKPGKDHPILDSMKKAVPGLRQTLQKSKYQPPKTSSMTMPGLGPLSMLANRPARMA